MGILNLKQVYDRVREEHILFCELIKNFPCKENIITPHNFNINLCDSPLEENLAELFTHKFPHNNPQDIFIYQQYPVLNYRLDFLIKTPVGSIGIEIDGKDYHDKNKDFYRDTEILKSGKVNKIFRFTGKIMFWFPMIVFKIILNNLPYSRENDRNKIIETLFKSELNSNFCEIIGETKVLEKYVVYNLFIKLVPDHLLNDCYSKLEKEDFHCDCYDECNCREKYLDSIIEPYRKNYILNYYEITDGKTN